MNNKTGEIIKQKRLEKNLTQLELANILDVTDRAISKWERGVGLPDASLWNKLSETLGISIDTLLNGYEQSKNKNTINVLRSKFYVCNKCNNIIHSYVEIETSCCGNKLESLKLDNDSYPYKYNKELIDNETYLKINHPMSKENYISFLAAISFDKIMLNKLYPEQSFEVRVPRNFKNIYIFDNKLGLFKI